MSQQQGNDLAAPEPLANTELDESAQSTIEDKLKDIRSKLFVTIEEAMFNYPDKFYIDRALDNLQAIITTETTKASKKQAEEHFMECLASDTCSSLESARNEKREALEKVMAALQKEHQKGDL